LVRLSTHAPRLREMILDLADMADACAYGNGDPQALRALAKVVAKKFTHSSQGPMNSRGAQ